MHQPNGQRLYKCSHVLTSKKDYDFDVLKPAEPTVNWNSGGVTGTLGLIHHAHQYEKLWSTELLFGKFEYNFATTWSTSRIPVIDKIP